jgi:hypothetical protein
VRSLVDIICKRYPNKKPSDYLDIEDKWTAFQIDSALAFAGEYEDREFQMTLVESINDHLVNVMRALGAKVKRKPKRTEESSLEGRPLNEVLTLLGGAGSVIKYRKKE